MENKEEKPVDPKQLNEWELLQKREEFRPGKYVEDEYDE